MPKIVYDVKFQIDDSNFSTVKDAAKKNAKSIDRSKESAEKLNQELSATKVQGQRANDSIQTFGLSADRAYEMASKSAQQFAGQQEKTNAQIGRGNKQFASANQLVFSFSDGIQDAAQFSQGFGTGMRAIGNNISFTAELLGVTARNAKEAGVSMKTALASAITPVTGAILALNVGLTVGQFIWNSWGKEAKESANVAEDAVKSFIGESSKLRDIGGFDFININDALSQKEALEDVSSTVTIILDQAEVLNSMRIKWDDIFGGTASLVTKTFDAINGRFDSAAQKLVNLENKFGITKEQALLFKDDIEALNVELERLTALEIMNPVARAIRLVSEETGGRSVLFEAGLISREQLESQVRDISSTINEIRSGGVPALRELLISSGADADILDEIGLSETDVAIAINNFQRELMRIKDMLPDRPSAPIQLPDDSALENFSELNRLILDNPVMMGEQMESDPLNFLDQLSLDSMQLFSEQAKENRESMQETLTRIDKSATKSRIATMRAEERAFRLSQRAKLQELNIYQQGLSAASSFAQSVFGENKALASAEALISTYLSAQQAYQSQLTIPTPDAPFRAKAAAAVAIASGLARVAAINSVNPNSGGNQGSATGGGNFSPSSDRQTGFFTTEPEFRPQRDFDRRGMDLTLSFEDGVDEVISVKAERGANKRKRGTVFASE